MSASGRNLLFLMSDEHGPKYMGSNGSFVRTPNLDALAARGTSFDCAYTTSPICVPARAALATGRYVHQMGYWDNIDAYEGSVPSWHHALRARGHEVVSVGKLHFRGRKGDDHGFSREIVPMHILGGTGDLKALVREPPVVRPGGAKLAATAKAGESTYTRYDRDIAREASDWLAARAQRPQGKPWALFVSFVSPHFPLTAPPEWFDLYRGMDLPMPKAYDIDPATLHPYLRDYRRVSNYATGFKTRESVLDAIAGYCGLTSFMDEQVGRVLSALTAHGFAENTTILYTSDHGDNVGARGLWGKSNMHEEAAQVPLIAVGPEFPAGGRVRVPASHVDIHPFVIGMFGGGKEAEVNPLAVPLDRVASADPERAVLSEYHAVGATKAVFMLRAGRWKYVHYVAYGPQLFDLESDPEELRDLASDPAHAATLARLGARLRALLDPDEVEARCKRRQRELIDEAGGIEAVMAAPDLPYSPAPGTAPDTN